MTLRSGRELEEELEISMRKCLLVNLSSESRVEGIIVLDSS